MTICKTRVKPFDVLIKNKMAIMTSVDRAIQMVDECQVKRRKGWPTTDKKPSTEEQLPSWKTVHCNNHLNWYNFFVEYLNPQQALFCKIIIEFLCYY